MQRQQLKSIGVGLLLLGLIVYVSLTSYNSIINGSGIVCDRCDMAIWRALELKLQEPDLFTRDRLFVLQYPLFPAPFSQVMNLLHRLTGHVEISDYIAQVVLATIFILGVYVLAWRITQSYFDAAVVVLLSTLTVRIPLSGSPAWGLPTLKPQGIFAAVSPWLMWLLFESLGRSWWVEVFTVATTLMVYVHPPTAIVFLGVGLIVYIVLGRGKKGYFTNLACSAVLSITILAPLLIVKAGAAMDAGPPLSILLHRASYVLFPTELTLKYLMLHMLFPVAAALAIYPKVHTQFRETVKNYLIALATVGIVITLLSSITYTWTGLAKFVLPSASRLIFFPTYVVLASGLEQAIVKRLSVLTSLSVLLAVAVIASHVDTSMITWGSQIVRARTAEISRSNELPVSTDADTSASTSSALAEIGAWAQVNTPRDALFLVPPDRASFRVLSKRSVVVLDKDGGNVKYGWAIAIEWFERMQEVTKAYQSGDLSKLQIVAQKYGAEFIVIPAQPGSVPDDALFANNGWIVWPARSTKMSSNSR